MPHGFIARRPPERSVRRHCLKVMGHLRDLSARRRQPQESCCGRGSRQSTEFERETTCEPCRNVPFQCWCRCRALQRARPRGRLNIHSNTTGGGRPILGPPLCCSFNLPLCTGLDSDSESQDQPNRRSRANSSSAEMPSSRSASSRASSSSASWWRGSRTAASSPRARTVTTV